MGTALAEAVPNLLIGLREGLEAGLVVSILLAALRKTASDPESESVSTAPVWLGVLGAVSVSASFAAVLTFSTDLLSNRAQEAVGGVLSVLAVGLVTAMVFWMRRAAAGLSAQLRGEVQRAAGIGAGALALTAFLAVGREGLETTLFLWTAVKASGSTIAPLAGAAVGLASAATLCWLLYRRAIKINLGLFFNRTALALIVIAAGVLAYGLGDLQEAGWLPGQRWLAFDLSAHVDANSWWASIITGVTELSPRMTVLQVVAWTTYLALVIPMFVRAAGRKQASPSLTNPTPTNPTPTKAPRPARSWPGWASRRPRVVGALLVLLPVAAAGATIAALPGANAGNATTVSITKTSCAATWDAAQPGSQVFTVDNESGRTGEIDLDNASGAVVGEIETIGPATSAELATTLTAGTYDFSCLMSGQPVLTSKVVTVSGGTAQVAPPAVQPTTVAELTGPNDEYERYAATQLTELAGATGDLESDLARDDLASARRDWLSAQLDWERVGASYDSFGAAGLAVDGLPLGLPNGVADVEFTGLHRLEYGLYHGQDALELSPVAATLAKNVAAVQAALSSDALAGDPTNLPVRAHEILEDAQRDHLSGLDDEGAGAAYAETYADVQATQAVLGELSPLLTPRAPTLVTTLDQQLANLQAALLAGRSGGVWLAPDQLPQSVQEGVDSALGAALESLSSVPDLLEVPPSP
ncbi:MAG: uncharacterized protein JWO63_528 [Frankiales bacterium]|nr:uncharacterized protein [Frankiales bacterium]